jgi:hypothetical protein
MSEPNIVIVGHVCIDQNVTENDTYTKWGSSVLYIAQYLQRTYAQQPTVISSYGPDMLPYLPEVNLLPAKPDQAETLRYENNTRSLPRTWKAHNISYAGEPILTTPLIRALKKADIVIVATLLPNYSAAYIQQILQYVKPGSLKALCPQGYFRHIESNGLVTPREFTEARQIVPYFDLVVYSEDDHPEAFTIAQQWLATDDNAQIIVTQGSAGASIINVDGITPVPTTPISEHKIIDSVGCGDVFAATAIYEFYKTKKLLSSVQIANRVAGRKLVTTNTIAIPK